MIDRSRWREELQARFSPSKTWPGPDVEEGWKDLLCDLADALDATGIRYSFVQLASHAGALRCLLGTAEDEPRMDELHAVVEQARERSRLICARCGKRGCACPTFSIGAALAQLQPCDWQEAERRALRLKASAVAQQALAAVAARTSMVPIAARDQLRAGLDPLSIDTEWVGPMVAWLDCLLRAQSAAGLKTGITADGLVTHTLQDCLRSRMMRTTLIREAVLRPNSYSKEYRSARWAGGAARSRPRAKTSGTASSIHCCASRSDRRRGLSPQLRKRR